MSLASFFLLGLIFDLDDGDGRFLRNVGGLLSGYMASHRNDLRIVL
jgi:hypothetical protein